MRSTTTGPRRVRQEDCDVKTSAECRGSVHNKTYEFKVQVKLAHVQVCFPIVTMNVIIQHTNAQQQHTNAQQQQNTTNQSTLFSLSAGSFARMDRHRDDHTVEVSAAAMQSLEKIAEVTRAIAANIRRTNELLETYVAVGIITLCGWRFPHSKTTRHVSL